MSSSVLCQQEQNRSLSSSSWRVGLTVACTVAALFALYCFAHSWLDRGALSPAASLRWGVVAGAPAGGLGWLLWSSRTRLSAYSARGLLSHAILLGSILLLLVIGGPILHGVAAQQLLKGFPLILAQRAFDLLPLAVVVVAALSAILVAVRRAEARPIAPTHQWLTLSDDPKLTLKRAEVVIVRAAGNYCEVQTGARVHLIREPIKVMTARLAPHGYLRVHRSTVINLERLRSIEGYGRKLVANMDDGSRVPVGRSFRANLAAATACSSRGSDIRP